jgi:hypothetical protein
MDSVSWVALGSSITLAGLLLSVLIWSRRGAGPGLRAVAVSLLPLAAALTGLLRLAGDVADLVSRWALRLVFSPVVWSGIVLAGVSVVLWGTGKAVSARTARRAPGRASATARPQAPAVTGRRGSAGPLDEDQDDIEAILRKHGIQ